MNAQFRIETQFTAYVMTDDIKKKKKKKEYRITVSAIIKEKKMFQKLSLSKIEIVFYSMSREIKTKTRNSFRKIFDYRAIFSPSFFLFFVVFWNIRFSYEDGT